MAKFNQGDTTFIIENNRFIREVKILKYSGGMYTIKFTDHSGRIKVRENRLFATKEDAENRIKNNEQYVKKIYGLKKAQTI